MSTIKALSPPRARKITKKIRRHGDTRTDFYYWLRQRKNRNVLKYLKNENRYADALMRDTVSLQKRLYLELKNHLKQTDTSAPLKIDNYYYYQRTEKGKEYAIFCRRRGSLKSREQVILDQNRLAAGHRFCALGVFSVSSDHTLLIYSVNFSGDEMYELRIKNLITSRHLKDTIPNTYYDVVWAEDNKTFFYTVVDSAKRPYKVMRHALGELVEEDQTVFHEKDETFFLGVEKSRSKKFIFINSVSLDSSEIHYIHSDTPRDEFRIIQPRLKGMEYYADHHEKDFYIRTNYRAPDFKIVRAPLTNPSIKNWKNVVAPRRRVRVESFDIFKDFLVVWEREEGLEHVRVQNLRTARHHRVSFPDPASMGSSYRRSGGSPPDPHLHTY